MKRKSDDVEHSEYEISKKQKTEGLVQFGELSIDAKGENVRRVINEFLSNYENLDNANVGDKKPNYSYTELIYLTILATPNFCLTTPEIYKHLQKKFLYFRFDTNPHWRNAVRHSLSKTKCFQKIKVRKSRFYRSMFLWSINPQSLVAFARGDYRPCNTKLGGKGTLRLDFNEENSGDFWLSIANCIQDTLQIFRATLAKTDDPLSFASQQSSTQPPSPRTNASLQKHVSSHADPYVQKPLRALPQQTDQPCLNEHQGDMGGGSSLEYNCYMDPDRYSPFSCESDSGISNVSSSKDEENLQDEHAKHVCLGSLNFLADDILREFSGTPRSVDLDLTPPREKYHFLYHPSLSAQDYINRGVVTVPPVMCHELYTLDNLTSDCYSNLLYPVNPYVGYDSYYGYC